MIDLADIKAIASPKEVAKYFLGMPNYEKGRNAWYCSPFRQETHPSFKVDDIGMYDFGSNESYDVFRFVREIKKCSFKESVEILASLFGVTDREYDSRSLASWYKEQREKQEEYRKLLNWFYLRTWGEVDKEYKINQQCLEIFGHDPDDETYKICLDNQASIWGMEEYLAQYCDTWEDKEKLMRRALKGDLPKWLMDRLKGTTTLWDLNIKLRQRREY